MFKVNIQAKRLASGAVRHVVRWRPQGTYGAQRAVPFDDPGHARLYAGLVYTAQADPDPAVLRAAGLGFLLGPADGSWTDAARGPVAATAAGPTLLDACAAYLATRTSVQPDTLDGYRTLVRRHVAPWAAMVGNPPLAEVHRADLAAWQAWAVARGASAKTVKNVKVAVLGPVFKRATWRGDEGQPPLRTDNPLVGLDPPRAGRARTRRAVVEGADAVTFFAAAYRVNADAADVLLAAAALGLRRGEVTGLCADMVDLDRGVVYVTRVARRQGTGAPRGQSRRLEPGGKSDAADRPVPIPAAVLPMFTARLAAAAGPGGLVFPNARTGGLWLGTAWQRYMTRVHTAAAAAGLTARVTAHSWRHMYKSVLAAGGVDPHTQNAALGHTGASGDPYFHATGPGFAAVRAAAAGHVTALAALRPASHPATTVDTAAA
jgi:integrase